MEAKSERIVRYDDITDNEVKFYENYGYLPLPGFIKQEYIERLKDEIDEALKYAGVDPGKLNSATEVADKLRHSNDYLENSLLDELINGEASRNIASRLIGGKAIRYFPFAVVKAGGGGGEFHFHQDNNYTRHDPAEGSINIWVAMVDMTPENGCLQIVPESNKLGVLESQNAGDGDDHKTLKNIPEGAIPIRMRAGDAVAFTRLTVHGSGPNVTSKARYAYALQYHREDVRYLDDDNQWKDLIDLSGTTFFPRQKGDTN